MLNDLSDVLVMNAVINNLCNVLIHLFEYQSECKVSELDLFLECESYQVSYQKLISLQAAFTDST